MINTLKKTMPVTNALRYIGLTKSTYFYASHPTGNKKRAYQFDPELKGILLNLQGYELTLGYRKLTKYLRNKYLKIWNKKKVYTHMEKLKLLQPKSIKRRYIKNRRLAVYCPIRSNVRWEADLTYVPTQMGNMYLFVVEDVYDKEILSGYMDIRCGADEAIKSLQEAIDKRFGKDVPQGLFLTLRIDRGCQFTAEDFATFAKSQGIALEFCGIQTPNDKPYVESFFSCYKREEVYRNVYEDFFQAYDGWKNYRQWYDELRPHGSLKDMTPKAFRESKISTVLV
jgi:putative transposase